jgi:sulfate permease, SulP family
MDAVRRWLSEAVDRQAKTLRGYGLSDLRGDVAAGATVAAVAVPQSMAYALIAGVPIEYGLYSLIVQCLIAALFSSSPYLNTGPINTQSLLVAATATRLFAAGSDVYLQLVVVLTVVKGVIQLLFAAARLGYLVQYVSQSVIVGFMAGAGVLVSIGQLPNFLGIDTQDVPRTLPGVLGTFQQMWPHLGQIQWPSVLVGVMGLLVVIAARRVSPLVPGPLLAVTLGAVMVYLMGWTPQQLPLVGDLPRSLPPLAVPRVWEVGCVHAEILIGGAIAMALMGLMEAYAVSKVLAFRTGGRVSANQELFGQGVTHCISSFFQCMPGSGSFSRTMLNYDAGARTRLSGVMCAILSAVVMLLLAGQARYVPLAVLAAILFVIGYGLIDWANFRRVARTHRPDAAVVLTTFLSTLILPLQYAIYIGIFLNIALYLRRAGRLHMAEMVQTPAGPFLERPIHDRTGKKRVMFLQVEGDLFFAVADELHDQLRHLMHSGVRVFVLRLKRTHSVDATVLQVLEQFTLEVQSRGGHVLLCGIRPELLRALKAFGLYDLIGRENIFEAGFGIFASAKRALQRARQLVQSSIDTERLDADLETEALTYEI